MIRFDNFARSANLLLKNIILVCICTETHNLETLTLISSRNTWLIFPWFFATCTLPQLKYKKRFLLRCIHHFQSDGISVMDQLRISGSESSSVILSQTKYFVNKVEKS